MKALIGMSGGVDSSVAALLMQQAGFECIGATMQLHTRRISENGKVCGGSEDAEDARRVAEALGMAHYVLDFQDTFQAQVMDRFAEAYLQGLTPNPCVECNRRLKFGALLQKGLDLGCECIASGHYARAEQNPDTGRWLLKRAEDTAKDQTYFLYALTQEQLSRIRFPLGALTKAEVRAIAEAHGFGNARKRDSQDICFVPEGDYTAFLAAHTGRQFPAGDFLDLTGRVVGRHRGAMCCTIGQRKGLGLAMGSPVYVCGKDMQANTVTVGPNEALFSRGLRANDWFFFPFPNLSEPMKVTAKIRYSQFDRPAVVFPEKNGFCRVIFDEPQRAITPGQAVVLYDGDTVVGGGTITEALR